MWKDQFIDYSVWRENPTFPISSIESLWLFSTIFRLIFSSLVSFRSILSWNACPSRWNLLFLSSSVSPFSFSTSSCKLDRKRNEYELCIYKGKKRKENHHKGVLERGNIWLATRLLSLTVIFVDLRCAFLPLMTRACVFERVRMSCFGADMNEYYYS